MVVRTDILPEELTEEERFVVEQIYGATFAATYNTRQISQPGERMRQPKPARDIDGFVRLVRQAVEDKQTDEEVPTSDRLIYTEESPPADMTTECITFSLRGREPASMGGPPLEGNRKELKPHIRCIENDPNHPGFRLVTLGQQFENEIEFTCWARTNKDANRRALWFEDLMREYAWYFKREGIGEVLFLRRLDDTTLNFDGAKNVIHARPLIYYVRTERLTFLSEPTIRRIVLRYGIGANNQ